MPWPKNVQKYTTMKIPKFDGYLRKNIIEMPKAIGQCSGIVVLGKKIKSILFSTDVAVIRNHNAHAVIAVYPFTPQPAITHALIAAADVPIFCGVGGGLTKGERSVEIALHAEFQGALGVVLNHPATNQLIERIKEKIEIPVIVTVVKEDEDFQGRIDAGVDFFNVSGASATAAIVRKIREISPTIGIIATGGRSDEDIVRTIEAGANAITYTPPSTADIFRSIMEDYRRGEGYKG